MNGEKLIIHGGHPLSGEVHIHGSKNAASKMMIASILTQEQCLIENIPLSAEIDITKELCQGVGSEVKMDPRNHSCTIQTSQIMTSSVPALSRKNRVPILAIGPLLHRSGTAEIPVLGGCPIGHRPVNLHMEALNKMGVRIERRENSYYASCDSIHGAEIYLSYPSVGATENILLTAVRAEGSTVIRNAAIEPEIMNLVEMLLAMGAHIQAVPESRMFFVKGVAYLHGAHIRVIPDRNEAVSFAAAALATEGDIVIHGVSADLIKAFILQVEHLGGVVEVSSRGLRFRGVKPYRAVQLETSPHPGFMTDWQQPFCVLLTHSAGESLLHETVYEDRFGYTKDLQRMGADITVSDECLAVSPLGRRFEERVSLRAGGSREAARPCRFYNQTLNHSVRIRGATKLQGAEITVMDIRAGMAHIIAALAAEGKSVISGVDHIDRGYERIDERLRELGADIERKA